MRSKNTITFLGTGGGRYVILSQRRYSGGLWLEFNDINISLDPGPGALVRSLQFHKDAAKLDAVVISHEHLDHYNDAEVMIEGMTHGMNKSRGVLVAQEGTLDYISDYHKSKVEVIIPEINKQFKIKDKNDKGEIYVEPIPTFNHPGVGFKFFTGSGIVTYTADTAFSEELLENYKDSKILILNVIFPKDRQIKTHLNTGSAMEIVRAVKPELAIIQHFGYQMLNSNPQMQARYIEQGSGVRTIAAEDGMVIDVGVAGVAGKGEGQLRLGGF